MFVDTSFIFFSIRTKQEGRQVFSNYKRDKTVGFDWMIWFNEKDRIKDNPDSCSIVVEKGSDAEHVIMNLFGLYLLKTKINFGEGNFRFDDIKGKINWRNVPSQ